MTGFKTRTAKLSRHLAAALAAAALVSTATSVVAQEDYPTRPITLVVAAGAGGGTDLNMRFIEPKMSEILGQPVVIDNRPGASGDTGAMVVAQAEPDGYTLLGVAGTITVNPSTKDVPYSLTEDLAPVSLLVKTPSVLVSHPSVPAENLQELIEYGKANPGELTFGSAGVGSIPHLQMELVLDAAGIEALHVPYPTIRPALNDVVAGHTDLVVVNITTALPLIQDGSVRAYGLTTSSRVDAAPDIPTLSEAGLSGYEAVQWFGMWAPAGTPPEVIEKVHAAVNEALQDPQTRERYTQNGVIPEGSESPEAFGEFVRSEMDKWRRVIETRGLEVKQ